jgi:hypothetical protein
MSSTCFEPDGSSAGRRLYIQVWYSMFYMHQYQQSCKVSINIGNVEDKTDCEVSYSLYRCTLNIHVYTTATLKKNARARNM